MINYAEYFNLFGLSFVLGFDRESDTEFDKDFRIVFGIDYCGVIVLYNYWGTYISFIGEL